jgi:spore germination cell wall hydrolase CwlJ-like protein
LLVAGVACEAAAGTSDRERRCLTLIAYAEAAGEGPAGMLAVMKVVHNRIADPRFADDACAVALEAGQFQPVAERPALRRALVEPEGQSLAQTLGATSRSERLQLVQAWRLAGAAAVWPAHDPTGGALYFVNPRLMDPRRCPWFARLKRTAVIGEHVFMRHYAPGERPQRAALDCAAAGKGRATSRPRLASD